MEKRKCFPYCDKVTWGFSGPAYQYLVKVCVYYLDARDPHVTIVILKGLSSTVLLMYYESEEKLNALGIFYVINS